MNREKNPNPSLKAKKTITPPFFLRHTATLALTLLVAFVNLTLASGPDSSKAKDNSITAEKASLGIHPDFEISLFADEKLGISNPIALQWDHRGRAWVLCTLAYAQLKPGEIPNDKIFILEDTDGDHYQVSLRHPDLDYEHGRIWRLTAKDKKLTQAPELDELSAEKLFPYLKSSDRWTRDQTERLLMVFDLANM